MEKTGNTVQSVSKKNFLERFIDFIFSNDPRKWLLLIFLLGIILRIFAAINVEPNADEMVHGPQAVGIINSGVIGRVWESILWSYLTDFFQKFIGITMFSSRFLSFLFGSLAIIVVYLLGKELFNTRVGLISSFLLAISSYSLVYTRIEMDIPAIFFVLLASYFFIKTLKKNGNLSYLAAIFIGIAALIKTLSLFFVPAFIIYYCMHHKKVFDKKIILSIIKFGLVILLVFSPIIIHNILWFEDKGMVDAYLSQYFNVGKSRQAFSSIQGINNGFKLSELFSGAIEATSIYFNIDPLAVVFGIFGLLFFLYKKEKFSSFFLMFQAFSFVLIVITNRLPTHYAVLAPVLALYSAALIDYVCENYLKNISYKNKILIVLGIFLIISMVYAYPYIGSKSGISGLRDYASKNMESSSIVVADARIYRGQIMWSLIDKHYLEASYFPQILELNNNISESGKVPTTLYFVECAVDDCGWGTVKDQPDFNKSMEDLVSLFKNSTQKIATITGGGNINIDPTKPYFNIYKTQIAFSPELINTIDSTHSFFYYPAYYKPKDQIIDNYDVNGLINNLLYLMAKCIIWLSLIFCLLCIVLPFYLLYKSGNLEHEKQN